MKCRLTKYEKETIILFNEAEPTANIYTYNKALQNRLAKFSRQNPKCARLVTAYPCGAVSYEVDKKPLYFPVFRGTQSKGKKLRNREQHNFQHRQ